MSKRSQVWGRGGGGEVGGGGTNIMAFKMLKAVMQTKPKN